MKRLALPVVIILAVALAPLTASCSWFKHEATVAETAVIDCGKTEVALAGQGKLASIILDIATQFAQAVISGNVLVTVENLAVVYGRPMVACVVKEFAAANAPAGSGSGSGSAAPSAPPSTSDEDPFAAAARQVIAKYGWKFKS